MQTKYIRIGIWKRYFKELYIAEYNMEQQPKEDKDLVLEQLSDTNDLEEKL